MRGSITIECLNELKQRSTGLNELKQRSTCFITAEDWELYNEEIAKIKIKIAERESKYIIKHGMSIDEKIRKMEIAIARHTLNINSPDPKDIPLPSVWLDEEKKYKEGWTGESKGGFGWKTYEYQYADGSKIYIEKMAICKGWKCGKEFPHNYDCCKECYDRPCTECGEKFGNPYKPMCKLCYAKTSRKYGRWKKVKKQGYGFI